MDGQNPTMRYTRFGALGWKVSRLSIGTVEFGIPYGFVGHGESAVPERADAKDLLLAAFDSGINLVDTSPTYGPAEEIVGEALKEWSGSEIFVAGKLPTWGQAAAESVERTLSRLRRDHLDLLQIYSRSDDWEAVRRALDVGRKCRDEGKTRALGITFYDETIGLAAAEVADLQVVQLPYNVLDRRMASRLIPRARAREMAIWGRSALLKGILTGRRRENPTHLATLVREAERLATRSEKRGLSIASAALRFCLSDPGIDSVLLGVRNREELRSALEALYRGDELDWMRSHTFLGDSALLDPRTWDTPH